MALAQRQAERDGNVISLSYEPKQQNNFIAFYRAVIEKFSQNHIYQPQNNAKGTQQITAVCRAVCELTVCES